MADKLFVKFNRANYLENKSEILVLRKDLVYLRKKILDLGKIRERKFLILKEIREKMLKISISFNKLYSYLPKGKEVFYFVNKGKNRASKKKEIKISEDLEKELIEIKKKIENLGIIN